MALHAETLGNPSEAAPLVLLHGFGGLASSWRDTAAALSDAVPIIAYDLPGHGGSLDLESGGAGRIARAILSDLTARGLSRVHLCGHSLGGAVATLIALRNPDLIASLTLLSPGGFGPEINAAALAAYASAETADDIASALQPMTATGFTFDAPWLDAMAAARKQPGAMPALGAIFAAMFVRREEGGAEQGELPIATLEDLTAPVTVLWGTDDHVLPIRQSQGLPLNCQVEQLQGVGHMLIEEAPEAVVTAIRRALAK